MSLGNDCINVVLMLYRVFTGMSFNIDCNGFDFFGRRVFDFSAPFSNFEAFSTIVVVVGVSFCIFLCLLLKAKHDKKRQ